MIDTFDETTEKVPVRKILGWARRPATKLVVGLVGVQTNQFPRALDLGREFRAHGLDVLMGGFHTSGTINMLSEQEPDIQTLFRESIVVVSGEVEGSWERILADVLNGQAQRLYSFAQDLKSLVDIEQAPLPVVSPTTMRHFARSSFGTVETSRGCPFTCSFCSIINVQGRTMRERSPEAIVTLVRDNYRQHGIDFYFFTDDNFARKKYWRDTFEGLIRLRKEEGIRVTFMMQVDLARKPPEFVRLAAEAGCTQVFMGLESVNPQNLKAESKGQNKVEAYQDVLREWHTAGIVGPRRLYHRPPLRHPGAGLPGCPVSHGCDPARSGLLFHVDPPAGLPRSHGDEEARRLDGPGLQQAGLVSRHHPTSAHDR